MAQPGKFNHMLRMTKQRSIILEELRKARTHPTADEIYARVKQHLPRISLGTVYRNLDTLSKAGVISRIEFAGGPRRFDGSVEEHWHVRCIGCGRIEDMKAIPVADFKRRLRNDTGYRITGHHIEFRGVCPKCENMVRPSDSGKGG
jgi:Fur family ferric uptake transcriptional regulator